MGEISCMIFDGVLCQKCGVYVGDPVWHPVVCEQCKKDKIEEEEREDENMEQYRQIRLDGRRMERRTR